MADVQALFEKFHSTIRTDYDTNDLLREKKDIIVRRVKTYLKKRGLPSCEEYIQGSYKMKVGILALEGAEYDIDVGLRFSFSEADHTPEEVRDWVFAAVDGHTDEDTEKKGNCIHVTYADGYHVDLVSYAWWDGVDGVTQFRLAHKTDGWRPADPPTLVQWVQDIRAPFDDTKDSATSTDQFRRVVRDLKRWNDNAILGDSPDKPSGLALLLLSHQHLPAPAKTWTGGSDDRQAIETIASAAASTIGRIQTPKPTPEYDDVFAGLSAKAMNDLKARFATLRDTLVEVKREADIYVACKRLKDVFGSDFPCPPKDDERGDVVRTSGPAIVTSSRSA